MRLISKLVGLLFVLTGLVFVQGTHLLSQSVYIWPDGYDADGVKWWTYSLYLAETHWNNESSIGSITDDYANSFDVVVWYSQIQNFNAGVNPWKNGDTIVAFGSWDSAYVNNPSGYGDNANHTGFYWLFSDTVDATVHPEHWSTDDTLRVLPKPIASQVGGPTGNIQISITNPAETRRVDQTAYDVLGFWIWADTTGEGTPDAFIAATVMEVGFFSVDGDAGDITICTHPVSNYHDGHTVYWAYKLVARPDTVNATSDTMGYSTYYFSQNSDPIVIIGIEENTNSKPGYVKLEISPNPFTDRTDIRFQITENQMQDVRSKNQEASLEIYDCSGRLVKSFNLTSGILLHASAVSWYGTDESGEMLPSGVYFVQAKGGDLNLTKKVILQR